MCDPLSILCLAVIAVFFLHMPMTFLLHLTNISHLGTIFSLLHLWPLMDFLFGRHFFLHVYAIYIEHVHIYAHLKNTMVHEVFSHHPQTFYIWKPSLFFHIYNPLSITCLVVIFVLYLFLLFYTCQ